MNKKANGMIVGIIIAVVVLGVLGYLGSFLLRPAPSANASPTPAINFADIDRSGTADAEDAQLIRSHLDCEKSQPCWNTTIGKTKDGDNPLYVFDLDLNKDGKIDQADLGMVME
jgi:hypothetical protein